MAEETPQYIGEYEDVPIDSKGRLIVPAPFRKVLPMGVNSFVVVRWFDGCLAGFDPDSWQQILQQLLALEGGQKQSRKLRRSIAGRAVEAKIDRQGRILIPRKLLERAAITEKATIIGAVDRIEIWSPQKYADYMDDADQKLEEIAEDMDL